MNNFEQIGNEFPDPDSRLMATNDVLLQASDT